MFFFVLKNILETLVKEFNWIHYAKQTSLSKFYPIFYPKREKYREFSAHKTLTNKTIWSCKSFSNCTVWAYPFVFIFEMMWLCAILNLFFGINKKVICKNTNRKLIFMILIYLSIILSCDLTIVDSDLK
jgi:hypothetical protein